VRSGAVGFHISLFPPPSPYESFDYASVRFSARHVHSRRRLRHQVRLTQAQAAPRMQDALVVLRMPSPTKSRGSKTPLKTTRPMPRRLASQAGTSILAPGEGCLMAPRPSWRGHSRFALVSCPVALLNSRHDQAATKVPRKRI
jgi:hypothetical protein